MRTRLLLGLVVVATLGCELLRPPKVSPPPGGVPRAPRVTVDLLWSRGLFAPANVLVRDGFVYVTQTGRQLLAKFNLVTGEEIWSTEVGFTSRIRPQWIAGKLWMVETPCESGTWEWTRLAEFDTVTGARTRRVRIRSAVHMPRARGAVAHGRRLFWGMTRDRDNNGVVFPYGVISVNTDPAGGDLMPDPDFPGEWRATPRMVYTLDSSRGPLDLNEVFGTPIVLNGLLIFNDNPHRYRGDLTSPSFLTGVDINTWKVKWRRVHTHYLAPIEYPLMALDSTRFLLQGVNVWQFDVSDPARPVVVRRYENASSTLAGHTVEGDSFYVSAYTPIAEGPRVYRVRLSDGALLWMSPRHPIQLGTNPQVHNGVVYVPGPRELELYCAETGALLGLDPRAAGQFTQFLRSERGSWGGGEFLVINFGGGLRVVRMNWRVVNGKLVKG